MYFIDISIYFNVIFYLNNYICLLYQSDSPDIMDDLISNHYDSLYKILSKIIHLLKRTFWLVAGVLIGFLVDDPALPFILKSQKKVSKQNLDVLIIGAGISGIAIAKVVLYRAELPPPSLFISAPNVVNMFFLETERHWTGEVQDPGGWEEGWRDLVLEQIPGSCL